MPHPRRQECRRCRLESLLHGGQSRDSYQFQRRELVAVPVLRRDTAMTFDRPWALLLVLLPIAWAAREWRLSARRSALLLKAGALACILLALSEPRLTVYQSKVAVAFLADTSASVTAQDLKTESALADKLEDARRRHWPRHQYRSRHPRWRRRPTRRHGAPPAVGLRRQSESRLGQSRYLAGPAARHPHRHRPARRASDRKSVATG